MEFRVAQDTDSLTPHPTRAVLKAGSEIIERMLADHRGQIAFRLWDGCTALGSSNAACTVVFREPGPLRDLIVHRDLLRLAEAYFGNRVDVEGDMEALFDLSPFLETLRLSWPVKARLLWAAFQLPPSTATDRIHTRRTRIGVQDNSRASIAHHYDVGNDFYALWLDPEQVYSCAYFRDERQDLAAAQRDKLDYLCRKLRLEQGQSLLDIGCGWGALACWAARHYGAKVHGITLSEEQFRFASERVRSEGLADRVKIEIRDYRDLQGEAQYDRVVSVGMFEHVGVKNFPVYFGMVRRVLKPDGLFLNHGITSETAWEPSPLTEFMNGYIFPDGELARVCDVLNAMESAGFEVVDVESLRRHYALTLRRWIKALEANRDAVIGTSSNRIYRLWRLYMAGCAYHFEHGATNVYQLLAGCAHQASSLPLRRDDLYVLN